MTDHEQTNDEIAPVSFQEALADWHELMKTACVARDFSATKIGHDLRIAGEAEAARITEAEASTLRNSAENIRNARKIEALLARKPHAHALQILSDETVQSWIDGTDAPRSREMHDALLHVLGLDSHRAGSWAEDHYAEMQDTYETLAEIGFDTAPQITSHHTREPIDFRSKMRMDGYDGVGVRLLDLSRNSHPVHPHGETGTDERGIAARLYSKIGGHGGVDSSGLKTMSYRLIPDGGGTTSAENVKMAPIEESAETLRARQEETSNLEDYLRLAIERGKRNNVEVYARHALVHKVHSKGFPYPTRKFLETLKPHISETGDTSLAGDYERLEALTIQTRLHRMAGVKSDEEKRVITEAMPGVYWRALLDHNLYGDAQISMTAAQRQNADLWLPEASLDFQHKGEYLRAMRLFFNRSNYQLGKTGDIESQRYVHTDMMHSPRVQNMVQILSSYDENYTFDHPRARTVFDQALLEKLPYKAQEKTIAPAAIAEQQAKKGAIGRS